MSNEQTLRPSGGAELVHNLEAAASLARHTRGEWDAGQSRSHVPANPAGTVASLGVRVITDPALTFDDQFEHWARLLLSWQQVAETSRESPSATPEAHHPIFDLVRQEYMHAAAWVEEQLERVTLEDPEAGPRVAFYTRRFIEALAPARFLLTSPEALQATLDADGQNLVRGLANLLATLERAHRGTGNRRADFVVGRDVAATPGKVIFENDLMQLLQYEPSTERVFRRPLLIVPPWTDRYYVLDLRPEQSFVRWAVSRGYTVFMVSWVNPDQRLADASLEDYLVNGPLAALRAVEQATGERDVSTLGYSIGGTLLAATLAYLAARKDARVTSCTLLATQVDFADSPQHALLGTEARIEALERRIAEAGGYLDAEGMATSFKALRADDLVWSYIEDNYLLGDEQPPFDLLAWNADTPRMPGRLASDVLRSLFQQNLLAEPGGLVLRRTPIDLGAVGVPVYAMGSRQDQVASLRSVFALHRHVRGPVRFVVARGGHAASVLHHAADDDSSYHVADRGSAPVSLDAWLRTAEERPGSWWLDWDAWLAPKSGPLVPARQPGDGALEPIEDAPGGYVLVRSPARGGSHQTED